MKPTKQKVYLPVTVESKLPEIRWNIIEDDGYFGDEWDNWEHMQREERFEYFKKVFSYFKSIEDSKQEAFVFTPEQLNELLSDVIKQCKQDDADKAKIDYNEDGEITKVKSKKLDIDYLSEAGANVSIKLNKQSITNTFEETFNKFKV